MHQGRRINSVRYLLGLQTLSSDPIYIPIFVLFFF